MYWQQAIILRYNNLTVNSFLQVNETWRNETVFLEANCRRIVSGKLLIKQGLQPFFVEDSP